MNNETFSEDTLNKVYAALLHEDIDGGKATDVVNSIQNEGILFRERPSLAERARVGKYTPEKVAELVARARKVQHAAIPELAHRLAEALEAVAAECERAKSGAATLGKIIERQVEDTLRWAGMEDQIGLSDPDQQLAWERCAEMPERIAELEAEVARLRAAADS